MNNKFGSIHIISTHPYILPLLLDLSMQTYKNFEIILVDSLFRYRTKVVKKVADKLGLNVKHYSDIYNSSHIAGAKQAIYRNECISHMNDKVDRIIFLDDHQRVNDTFIEGHMNNDNNVLTIGRWFEMRGSNLVNFNPNVNLTDILNEYTYDERLKPIDFGGFWTCNSSTSKEYVSGVNGFDNRYTGGTGGEDYDLAYRIVKKYRSKGENVEFKYESNSIAFHFNHDIYSRPKKCNHNPSYFAENPYENGDREAYSDKKIISTWNLGVKMWYCPNCGKRGIVDSLQVFDLNMKNW